MDPNGLFSRRRLVSTANICILIPSIVLSAETSAAKYSTRGGGDYGEYAEYTGNNAQQFMRHILMGGA